MALNEQQQKAVDTLWGPLMILAGAGSGKTRVIIHRIANLIRHGVHPENILAVTFTNKAAGEMRERVAGLLTSSQAERVTVSTFHAFCMSVLRHHIHRLGYSRNFGIASEGYQRGLIREIISENHYTGPGCDSGLWLSYISNAKASLKEPEDIFHAENIIRAQDVANVYRIYQTKLRQMDLVDFDDLLTLTVKLWQEFPNVLENYREQFHHLLIDEYQDTNTVQLKIMVMLAGERKNICVVGDDDQSIYGWRGANLSNILDFETYFPGAAVIRLEQNYRSTNTILKSANKLIANNVNRRAKNLWSKQGDGEHILAVLCENEHEEAGFVCDYIRDQVVNGNWGEFAVLFRAGQQSRVLEEVFHRKNIPYVLVGANSFFKRKEILDALAFLKLVSNPKDDLAMLQVINVPPRGIGDVTIEKLRELRKITHLSIHDAADTDTFKSAVTPDIRENVATFNGIIRDMRSKIPESGAVYPIAVELLERIGYMDGLVRMYKPREDAMKRRDNVREFLTSIAEYDEAKHNKGSL
ncbi:MAG: UvrD-helicase domain-containing protein, partial [Victivallales bacterium]|nr:UvrD-helicase domain-containing protein [Victivallales bacterium]